MADLYVLAVDLPDCKSAYANIRKYRAGDVIFVLEDGEGPGTGVEKSGMYKVVRVPGRRSAWEYLTADRPDDRAKPEPRRLRGLDVTAVYDAEKTSSIVHPKMGTCIAMTALAAKALEADRVPAVVVVDIVPEAPQ